jgi:hypothetical protein
VLGLSTYRLERCRTEDGAYEVLDLNAERPGVVYRASEVLAERGPVQRRVDSLVRYRLFRYLAMAVALPVGFAWLIGAILGLWPFHSREKRPRLVVRRPGDERAVLMLRVSSGMMYDSRRVYDGQGRLVAQFRSHFKTTLGGGFGVIDLRGLEDDDGETGDRPWLGCVELKEGNYRLRLVGHRDAGWISPSGTPVDSYEVQAAAGLRDGETGELLLLAVALALAWWPPAA